MQTGTRHPYGSMIAAARAGLSASKLAGLEGDQCE
jgi:hypothetical protein